MTHELDLIVLVADLDAEQTLKTLFTERTKSLGIRPIAFKVLREKDRDPGVVKNGVSLMRNYVNRADYALVLLDYEGSGREKKFSATELEKHLEDQLHRNGWLDEQGHSRVGVIVLDPELEMWVWSPSQEVVNTLRLGTKTVQDFLSEFETLPNGKPKHPKEVMQIALRRVKQPRSARIFQELAQSVSLRTDERAFTKLRQLLQIWFSGL